jgi:hypothetical protein
MKTLFDEEYIESNTVIDVADITATPIVEEISYTQFQDFLISLITNLSPREKDKIVISCGKDFYKKICNSDLSCIMPYSFNGFSDIMTISPFSDKSSFVNNISPILSQYQLDMRMLLDAYYHINDVKFQNKSLAEMIWQNVTSSKEKPTVNFNKWSISLEEYNHLNALLSEAASVFEKVGKLSSENADYLHLYDYEDKETLSIALWQIVNELTKVRRKINAQFGNITKVWNKEVVVNYKKVYQPYVFFKQDVEQFILKNGESTPKKPGLLSFNKQNEIVYNQFDALRKRCLELLSISRSNGIYESKLKQIESIHDLKNEIDNIFIGLTIWEQNNSKRQSDKMQRLSTLNLNNIELTAAHNTIIEVVQKLNKLSIRKGKWECNTNLCIKHLAFIDDTILEIEKMLQVLSQNGAMIEKDRFLASLNHDDQLFIKKFLDLPINEWFHEFNKYFLPLLTRALYHPLAICDDVVLQKVVEDVNQFNEIRMSSLPTLLEASLASNIKQVKEKDPKLYKQFFQKPATFNKQDYYKSDIDSLHKNYQIHFIENGRNGDDVKVELSSGKGAFYYVISKDDNNIELNKIIDRISTIHLTEQYGAASALAKSLSEYAQNINIYQLKSANIISTLPINSVDIISQLLDKYGVKKLRPVQGILDCVKDCILSFERKQYVIILDGLIDGRRPQDVVNQRMILNKFETAGYEIINLWSVDLMYDAESVFETMVHKLSNTK